MRQDIGRVFETVTATTPRWETSAALSQVLAKLLAVVARETAKSTDDEKRERELQDFQLWLVDGKGLGFFGGFAELLSIGEPSAISDFVVETDSALVKFSHKAQELSEDRVKFSEFAASTLELISSSCKDAILDCAPHLAAAVAKLRSAWETLQTASDHDGDFEALASMLKGVEATVNEVRDAAKLVHTVLEKPTELLQKAIALVVSYGELSELHMRCGLSDLMFGNFSDIGTKLSNASENTRAASMLLVEAARLRGIFRCGANKLLPTFTREESRKITGEAERASKVAEGIATKLLGSTETTLELDEAETTLQPMRGVLKVFADKKAVLSGPQAELAKFACQLHCAFESLNSARDVASSIEAAILAEDFASKLAAPLQAPTTAAAKKTMYDKMSSGVASIMSSKKAGAGETTPDALAPLRTIIEKLCGSASSLQVAVSQSSLVTAATTLEQVGVTSSIELDKTEKPKDKSNFAFAVSNASEAALSELSLLASRVVSSMSSAVSKTSRAVSYLAEPAVASMGGVAGDLIAKRQAKREQFRAREVALLSLRMLLALPEVTGATRERLCRALAERQGLEPHSSVKRIFSMPASQINEHVGLTVGLVPWL